MVGQPHLRAVAAVVDGSGRQADARKLLLPLGLASVCIIRERVRLRV